MMSKCANPNCSSVFRYLREGKLFQVPAGVWLSANGERNGNPAKDEFFWLCGNCSKELTIAVDPIQGVRTVSRNQSLAMRAAG